MHPVNRKKHQLAHRSLSQPVFQDLPKVSTENNHSYSNPAAFSSSPRLGLGLGHQRSPKRRRDRSNMMHSQSLRNNRLETSDIQLSVENLNGDVRQDPYYSDHSQHYANDYIENTQNNLGQFTNKAYRTPSPNHDSAIENTSPSSVSSGSFREQPVYRPNMDRYGISSISESEETISRGKILRHHSYHHSSAYGSPDSYYGMDGVAVSQI